MRIVSLLPAATDLVAELGLLPYLVGRTHECDWPPEVASVPVVTSTSLDPRTSSREISDSVRAAPHTGSSLYALDTTALAALEPDVVLTQDLCEVCALSYRTVAAGLRELPGDVRVLSLEPRTLDGILDGLVSLGEELGVGAFAGERAAALRSRLAAVSAAAAGRTRPRVAAIEWLDPVWPAGHWVPEQIAAAGGEPLLAAAGEHTAPVAWTSVVRATPEVVLLLPCGLSPDRTRAELSVLTRRPGWPDLPAVRAGRVWVLDGPAYFNRPGPRVVRGAEILAHVLHGVTAGRPVSVTEAVPI